MSTWPSTLPTPSWGLEEEHYKPQDKIEFEANYVQSRPLSTRARDRWGNLGWALMSEAEYQILEAFFDANQGNTFTFVHPMTGVSRTCLFSTDSIKSKYKSPGWRQDVQCPIEEL
jgi:hypothetical protein